MVNRQKNIELRTRLDRRLVGVRGGELHLLADLEAAAIKTAVRKRPPLNLALVIDASGSMQGAPLAAAKMAVRAVARRLDARDRLTVVSFAEDVVVHMRPAAVDAAARKRLAGALDQLDTRGCTDLAAGWLAACELVAEADRAAAGSPGQSRVILLSDGHANRGLTESATLAGHAAEMRSQGVCSSAVGIGDGYSPVQLDAIAMHGGGRLHDAPAGEDIVAVVLGELDELMVTAGSDLVVELRGPAGLSVSVCGRYPVTQDGLVHRVGVGSLMAGGSRQLVVRLRLGRAALGTRRDIAVNVTWVDPVSGLRQAGPSTVARVTTAGAADVREEVPDPEVGQVVARLWQRDLQLDSTLLNSEGEIDGACSLLAENMPAFQAYCDRVPGTSLLVKGLAFHAEIVRSDLEAGTVLEKVSRLNDEILQVKAHRVNTRSR